MSETQSDSSTYEDPADLDTSAPEGEAPPAAETSEAAPRQKQTVPLAVLMEEREALKRERAERQRLQEQFDRGTERLQQLYQQFQQPAPPPQPMPDINSDPVGFFKAELEATRRELAEVKQFKQEATQQTQAQMQQQAFVARYSADAAQFMARSPDFPQAYEHIKESLVRDFLEAGYTPQDAIAELQDQERKIAERAFREGRSPAEAIYKLAKSRGFAPPPPQAEARMDAMQRGQQAARTTSGGTGRGRFDGMTLENLANLPLDEFAKVPNDIKRRLMGG